MRSRANSGEQICIPGAISSMLPAGSGAPHTETRLRRENLRPAGPGNDEPDRGRERVLRQSPQARYVAQAFQNRRHFAVVGHLGLVETVGPPWLPMRWQADCARGDRKVGVRVPHAQSADQFQRLECIEAHAHGPSLLFVATKAAARDGAPRRPTGLARDGERIRLRNHADLGNLQGVGVSVLGRIPTRKAPSADRVPAE